MKVLFLCPSAAYGGAERYAVTIASAARDRGFTVRAAVPYLEATQDLLSAFHAGGVSTFDLTPAGPGPRLRRITCGTLRLVRLIRRFAPDAIHLTLPWPTAGFPELLTCALLRTPTVVVFALVPDHPDLGRRVRLLGWARRRCQAWVAMSEHGRRALAESLAAPTGALHRIYNGVSSSTPAAETATPAVKSSFRLPGGSTVMLTVGRLDPQKGHADLLAAVARLGTDHPELGVVIAGEGAERKRLEHLVDSHGLEDRVRLLGQVTNVPELMRAADLFVFPSHFEGHPLAMLDAMAHDVPVIAARFGGADEVIEDGQSGLLAPVGDPDALADRIDWALRHPQEMLEMAERARHRLTSFSQPAMIEQTLALLRETADRRWAGARP